MPPLVPTVPASSFPPTLTQGEIASLLEARQSQPHALLGMHQVTRPLAEPRILVSGQEKVNEEPACSPKLDLSGIALKAKPEERRRKCTQAYMRIPNLFLTNPETKRQRLCVQPGLVVRAFVPGAIACTVLDLSGKAQFSLPCLHADGLFEGFSRQEPFPYKLKLTYPDGSSLTRFDPYSFLPTLSEEDLHLLSEGNHHYAYKKLGSQFRTLQGVEGVAFAVWAPNARRVSVVGDFNHWDGRAHPLRSLGASGIWELFIPGLPEGVPYKYELLDHHGTLHLKTDPHAFYYEGAPHHAAITYNIEKAYTWNDAEWLKARSYCQWQDLPLSIYEVHLGSWKRVVEDGNRPLTYREIAPQLAAYVKHMGFTHVEFLPLAEHPFEGSWGYQVTGFFAPTHRYGSPEDFMYLVDTLHQNGIGVIMDWVPAHFPKDAFALAHFDGTHLYDHADPRQGHHQDWGTLIFNYGRNEVSGFLIASALAWLDYFHIDGFRVDAVASMLYLDYSRKYGEWLPNAYGGRENLEAIAFLKKLNGIVHHYYPGVLTIAEESTAWPGVTHPSAEGGLGFDFKWNMGWMHDMRQYLRLDPIHRKHHHDQLTFGMLYQYSERFVSVFSHDEVVHGKGSLFSSIGSWNSFDKAQTLKALYAYMWFWPGKKTLFMGCEWGQEKEWNAQQSLDWHLLDISISTISTDITPSPYAGIQAVVRDLNRAYLTYPSLAKGDHRPDYFQWLVADDGQNSVLSFLRLHPLNTEETFLIITNFTPLSRHPYRVGVPYAGYWKEYLNTNSSTYAGNNAGNLGGLHTHPTPSHGRPYALDLFLPPLTTLILQYQPPQPRSPTA